MRIIVDSHTLTHTTHPHTHTTHTHTHRKVKDESATGSSTTNRVRTTLTITVENIEFDTAACELRVKGRNIQENQYVKVSDAELIYHTAQSSMFVNTHTHARTHAHTRTHTQMGAYHTIDLQLNQKLTLCKQHWDVVALDRLGGWVCQWLLASCIE